MLAQLQPVQQVVAEKPWAAATGTGTAQQQKVESTSVAEQELLSAALGWAVVVPGSYTTKNDISRFRLCAAELELSLTKEGYCHIIKGHVTCSHQCTLFCTEYYVYVYTYFKCAFQV